MYKKIIQATIFTFICACNHKVNALIPFTVTTIPKTGTHLLTRCLELLTRKTAKTPKFLGDGKETSLAFGRRKFIAPADKVVKQIAVANTAFPWLHAAYSHAHAAVLVARGNIITLIRDPRDQIISRYFWIKNNKKYKKYTHDELISALIGYVGQPSIGMKSWIPEYITDSQAICNPSNLYNAFLPWHDMPECYVARFENLVGPRGGSSREAQIAEIIGIAKHIDISLTETQAASIADQLFGASYSFREGVIGNWKKHFTSEHKKQFKKVAGKLLIHLGYEQNMDW